MTFLFPFSKLFTSFSLMFGIFNSSISADSFLNTYPRLLKLKPNVTIESILQKDVLQNYQKSARPGEMENATIEKLDFAMLSPEIMWVDDKLHYGGLHQIINKAYRIWTPQPQVQLLNRLEELMFRKGHRNSLGIDLICSSFDDGLHFNTKKVCCSFITE